MFWLPLPLHLYLYLKTIWISISWSRKKRKCWRVYLKENAVFLCFCFIEVFAFFMEWITPNDEASFQSSHDSFIWTIITKVTISKNSANKKYKNKNSMNTHTCAHAHSHMHKQANEIWATQQISRIMIPTSIRMFIPQSESYKTYDTHKFDSLF